MSRKRMPRKHNRKHIKLDFSSFQFFQILRRRNRIIGIITSFIGGFCLLALAVWHYDLDLPIVPVEIRAGPCPPCEVDRTHVMVSIPAHAVSVTVYFNSCTSSEYRVCVLLPFIVNDVTASVYTPPTGNIPLKALFENLTDYGACIATAIYRLNITEWLPEVQMHLAFHLYSDIEATRYWLGWNPFGSTRAVILTFFGPRGKLGYPEKLYAYTDNTSLVIGRPLFIHFNIPSGTYLSSETFPTPIQYYIREDQTWAMFHPIFPMDNYAQTIACFFVNPLSDLPKQILIFLAGIAVGIGGSLVVEWWKEKTNNLTLQK